MNTTAVLTRAEEYLAARKFGCDADDATLTMIINQILPRLNKQFGLRGSDTTVEYLGSSGDSHQFCYTREGMDGHRVVEAEERNGGWYLRRLRKSWEMPYDLATMCLDHNGAPSKPVTDVLEELPHGVGIGFDAGCDPDIVEWGMDSLQGTVPSSKWYRNLPVEPATLFIEYETRREFTVTAQTDAENDIAASRWRSRNGKWQLLWTTVPNRTPDGEGDR